MADAIRKTFDAFVIVLAPSFGLTASAVGRSFEARGEPTRDPCWRQASHCRQVAIYLTHVVGGYSQRQIARALSMTPGGVCRAVQAVEGRRELPAYDRLVEQAERAAA